MVQAVRPARPEQKAQLVLPDLMELPVQLALKEFKV
jgi:hypothetical protein